MRSVSHAYGALLVVCLGTIGGCDKSATDVGVPTLTGIWDGTVELSPGVTVDVEIAISQSARDSLSGSGPARLKGAAVEEPPGSIVVQGNVRFPVVTLPSVRFSRTGLGLDRSLLTSYVGTLSSDGHSLTGLLGDDVPVVFNLSRRH